MAHEIFCGGEDIFRLRRGRFRQYHHFYETMATMCPVRFEKCLKVVPVMLSRDALIYFSANIQRCSSYDEAVNAL